MIQINDPTNLRKDLFVQNNEWLITNSNGYFPNDRLFLSKLKKLNRKYNDCKSKMSLP